MKKVKLLCDIKGGLQKAGWGVELSDEAAAILVAKGQAEYMDAGAPLKKGNLELYNGCTPLSPGKIAAMGLMNGSNGPEFVAPKLAIEKAIKQTNTTKE